MDIPSSPIGNSKDILFQMASVRDQRTENGKLNPELVKTNKELKEIAQNFESILIHKMLESMQKTVPKSGLLDSFAGDMYESMFYEEVANEMSKREGLGLAEMVYRELSRLNEKIHQAKAEKPFQNPGSNASGNVIGRGE